MHGSGFLIVIDGDVAIWGRVQIQLSGPLKLKQRLKAEGNETVYTDIYTDKWMVHYLIKFLQHTYSH